MASFYKIIMDALSSKVGAHRLLKYGFNISPMYRRSTGRIKHMSKDMRSCTIKIAISWKNRNYMNSIYGGSMFSAIDPVPMMQLLEILGKDYVVWDKAATIHFKRPAREDLYCEIIFTEEEINHIKQSVATEKEVSYVKEVQLKNKDGSKLFSTIDKVLYIADKTFYLEKKKEKNHQL